MYQQFAPLELVFELHLFLQTVSSDGTKTTPLGATCL
jgi:hypothetical protein